MYNYIYKDQGIQTVIKSKLGYINVYTFLVGVLTVLCKSRKVFATITTEREVSS